jgi:transposase-like protein
MQEQIETRAGLNGSGMAHPLTPTLDTETALAPESGVEVSRPRGKRPSALDPIMADPEQREALRREVMETIASIGQIAQRWGVHPETLRRRIGAEKWTRPEGAPKAPDAAGGKTAGMRRLANSMADAGMVQARILRAVDRQIGKVDARLRKKGAEVEERDSRILGNLAKTLGALMDIGSGGTTPKDMERPNRAEVEARLADRIRRWARGEEGPE